ncbi:MAG: MSCRAMM family protein [Gemmatimonadaceae bacterium]
MRSSRHALPVLLMSALLALGCRDDSESTGPQNRPADIAGSVTLVKTATAVPNAVVVLRQDDMVLRAAVTDAEGTFFFDDVPAGSYTLRLTGLELTGVNLLTTSFAPLEQAIDVGGGELVRVFFAGAGLVPARIVGHVRCDGVVVPDAAIRVVGGPADVTVTSSDQGKYGATSLPAGFYAVLLVSTPTPCTFASDVQVVEVLEGQQGTVDFDGQS